MKIIDPHLHLFNLEEGQYDWLKADAPPFWQDKHVIAKSFSEEDLVLVNDLHLSGFVHIEAGFNNNSPHLEVQWLENSCKSIPFKSIPFKSIIFSDLTLTDQAFKKHLETIAPLTSIVGSRHILDDDELELLSSKQVQKNLEKLNKQNLTASKWIFELQANITNTEISTRLHEIVNQHSNINFVINHAGWPSCNQETEKQWYNSLSKLSQCNNVYIKCSGWEMHTRDYDKAWVSKVISICIELFGIKRVMLASNFPLTLFSQSYQSYWQMISEIIPTSQQEQLCYLTAKKLYQL